MPRFRILLYHLRGGGLFLQGHLAIRLKPGLYLGVNRGVVLGNDAISNDSIKGCIVLYKVVLIRGALLNFG